MDYSRIYKSLIDKRKKYPPCVTEYSELHHIVPRCMGGTNSPTNMVSLTGREHLIAHALLCKIYPCEPKLLYAFRIMLNANNQHQQRCRTKSKAYEALKKKAAAHSAERLRGSKPIYNLSTGTVRYISKDDEPPCGWAAGTNTPNNLGKLRYYNSSTDTELVLRPEEELPEGFVKGRRPIKRVYSRDGTARKYENQPLGAEWFETPVKKLKIVNVETGDVVSHYDVDPVPIGYVKSIASGNRKITAVHLKTKGVALLTWEEYESHVEWVRAGSNITCLYHTDIGPVRSKDEYIRKSGRSINIVKYCEGNKTPVSNWLVKRSKLPTNWIGLTWEELGFFVIEI